MTFPAHVLTRLVIASSVPDHIALERLVECSGDWAGLLSSEDARSEFISLSKQINDYGYDEYPSYLPNVPPRSIQVLRNGTPWFSLAIFPSSSEACRVPPGGCEKVILVRWLLDSNYNIDSWYDHAAGKGMVWWQERLTGDEDVIAAEIISAICENAVDKTISPFISAAVINVLHDASSKKLAIKLLTDGLTEHNPKWRYLSLYRSIENGYLEEIKSQFDKEFFQDPQWAVNRANDALKSEMKQFFGFVQQRNLEDFFVDFAKAFDSLIQDNDRFAHAIDRSLRSGKSGGEQAPWQRGVARSYKVRCAIAHAGSGDTFIELHDGWRHSLEKMLPSLERAALKSCSIDLD